MTSRLQLGRRSSESLLTRDTRQVSFDVFGVALEQAVLNRHDIHSLVASILGRTVPALADTYVDLRLQTERQVRLQADSEGRAEISVADIRDRLPLLFDHRMPIDERDRLAKRAIKYELQYEGLVNRANPWCLELYREAVELGAQVAFVADSALPRDLISEILSDAGYQPTNVFVSSQEGVTKASGELLKLVCARTGIGPEQTLHVGADQGADVERPTRLGFRCHLRVDPRQEVESAIGPLAPLRRGVESFAFSLSADRLAQVGSDIQPADLGYYAAGPMLAGFAATVGATIEREQPNHVLFCGPSGRLIRRLTATLWPDISSDKLHLHRSGGNHTGDNHAAGDNTAAKWLGSVGLDDDERLLAVDTGWHGLTHVDVGRTLEGLGHKIAVRGVYLGVPAGTKPGDDDHSGFSTWAFDGGAEGPIAPPDESGLEVLDALIPTVLLDGDRTSTADCDDYRAAAPRLLRGIERFTEDFVEWFRRVPGDVGPSLIGPALRVVHEPSYAEAALLGSYPSQRIVLDDGPAQLATLPGRVSSSRDPHLVDEGGETAIWSEGYQALAGGDPQANTARLIRRFGRAQR